MSEAVRTYTGNRSAGYSKYRRRRNKRKGLFRAVTALFFATLLWSWWSTRDVHSLGALLPNDQAYYLCAPDFLQRRAAIAESAAWNAVPESSSLHTIRQALSNRFGQAEWLVNNVFQGPVYLSGQDLDKFSDVLFATRMSRIGALAEKAFSLFPSVKNKKVGEVRLRYIESSGYYYAVRGRILLVSRSDAALAGALTLPAERMLGEDALAALATREGDADLVCTFHSSGSEWVANVVENAQFSAQWLPRAFRIHFQGSPRQEWRERLAPLLEGVTPQPLPAPLDGLISVSCNFEKTLPQLWTGIATAWGDSFPLASVPDFVATPFRKTEAWSAFGDNLARHLGPAIRLTLGAVDQNAMLPTPEFAAQCQLIADDTPAWPPEIEADPAGYTPEDMTPRFDKESQRLTIPTVDGPSLQPTFAAYGDGVFVSTSSALAEAILAVPPKEDILPQPANLFVRIQPHATLDAFYNGALQFVQLGLVRNYDPATFEAAVTPWLRQCEQVHSIVASASYEDGTIRLDAELSMLP